MTHLVSNSKFDRLKAQQADYGPNACKHTCLTRLDSDTAHTDEINVFKSMMQSHEFK